MALGQGLERPFDVKFGPDGAMYIVDYGVARINPASEGTPYVFPPETGVIWKVTATDGAAGTPAAGDSDALDEILMPEATETEVIATEGVIEEILTPEATEEEN